MKSTKHLSLKVLRTLLSFFCFISQVSLAPAFTADLTGGGTSSLQPVCTLGTCSSSGAASENKSQTTNQFLSGKALSLTNSAKTIIVNAGSRTIQSAINEARAGDRILISGQFNENNLTLKEGVSLESSTDAVINLTTTRPENSTTVTPLTLKVKSGMTIKGITVRTNDASAAYYPLVEIESSVVLEDCKIMGSVLVSGNGNTLLNNSLEAQYNNALQVKGDNNTVKGNLIVLKGAMQASSAASDAYVIVVSGRNTTLDHNTVAGFGALPATGYKTVIYSIGLRLLTGAGNRVSNNIFSGNGSNAIVPLNSPGLSAAEIRYNLFDRQFPPIQGNLIGEAKFINAAAGNYYLQNDSPAIDAGDPASLNDSDGTRSDIGALGRAVIPASAIRFTNPYYYAEEVRTSTPPIVSVTRYVIKEAGTNRVIISLDKIRQEAYSSGYNSTAKGLDVTHSGLIVYGVRIEPYTSSPANSIRVYDVKDGRLLGLISGPSDPYNIRLENVTVTKIDGYDVIKAIFKDRRNNSIQTLYYDAQTRQPFYLVPAGWTRAASNPNFAFQLKLDPPRVGGGLSENAYLYVMDLRNQAETYLVGGGNRVTQGVDKFDVSPDGQIAAVSYVEFGSGNSSNIAFYRMSDLKAGKQIKTYVIDQAQAVQITFGAQSVTVLADIRGTERKTIVIPYIDITNPVPAGFTRTTSDVNYAYRVIGDQMQIIDIRNPSKVKIISDPFVASATSIQRAGLANAYLLADTNRDFLLTIEEKSAFYQGFIQENGKLGKNLRYNFDGDNGVGIFDFPFVRVVLAKG